jgi:hypothetical protein
MMRGPDIAPPDSPPSRSEPDTSAVLPAETHDAAPFEAIAAVLEARFGSSLTPAARHEIARQALEHYRDASVLNFVSILGPRLAVEIASQRLRAS